MRYKLIPIIQWIIILVCIFITEPHASSADSLLNEHSKKLALHKHFCADFTQSRYMSMFKKPLVSTGTIFFSYPDKIKFHYKTPFESIILLSEDSMERYRIEQGKKVKQPSQEIVARSIAKEVTRYLGGNFSDEFPYDVTVDSNKPRKFILIPTHSMAKAVFSSIELTFSEDSLYIEEIKLIEQTKDYIHIKHERPSFETLPDSLFGTGND
jgi:outer membrane lipoprotein-sorting protein